MNMKIFKSREDIAKAREALQRGDKESAWKLGRHAALALNPQSTRAHRAVEWALGQAKQVRVHSGPSRWTTKAHVEQNAAPQPQQTSESQGDTVATTVINVTPKICNGRIDDAANIVRHPARLDPNDSTSSKGNIEK